MEKQLNLSNTKRKLILRMAAERRPLREISKAVNMPPTEVEAVLAELSKEEGASPLTVVDRDRQLRNILAICFLALVAAAPFMFGPKLYNISNLPQMVYVQVISLLLLALWFGYQALSRDRLVIGSPIFLPLGLFLTWAGLSYFWSINRFEHLVVWGHWLACGTLLFLAVQIFRHRFWLRILLRTLHFAGFGVALLGVCQHLFGLDIVQQVAPPAATFANKNFAVHVVVPALALGMAFMLRGTWRIPLVRGDSESDDISLPVWWIYTFTCAIMIAYLFYTGTRAGWLAFAVQLLLWALFILLRLPAFRATFSANRAAAAGVGFLFLLLMIHLTPTGFQWTLKPQLDRIRGEVVKVQEFTEIDEAPPPPILVDEGVAPPTAVARESGKRAVKPRISAEASFAGRLKVWRNTLLLIKDRPLLGTGVGNFGIYFPIYDGLVDGEPMFTDKIQITNTHNDYMQLWSETGTVGLLLLVWTAITVAILFVRLWRRETEDLLLILGIFIALAGMGVNAIFSSPLQKAIPPLLVAMLLAALSGWDRQYRGKGRAVSMKPAIAVAGAAAALIGLLALGSLQLRRIRCDGAYVYTSAAARQQMWDQVYRYAKLAEKQLPARRKVNAYIGKSYIENSEKTTGNERRRYLNLAIEEFEKVLEVYPWSPNSLFDLAVTYAKLGESDKALEYYFKLNELMPNYPRLHNNIAAVFLERAKNPELTEEERHKLQEEALAEFRLETRLSPENERVWFNLGSALRSLGRHQDAEKYLQHAVAVKPEFALGHKELGVLYYQFLNQREEGIRHLRKAVELDPEISEADKIRQITGQSK